MGRSFTNLHIKSKDLEKIVEVLREHAKVLGISNNRAQEIKAVMYVSKSNENWISVLHDYFAWGTVKKIGKILSRLIEQPVMTAGYMNEEVFELSFFESGDIQAERIFCEQWTREEYEQLKEGCLNDDYLRKVLDVCNEDFEELISLTSPEQAVNRLSELVKMSLWSDAEWIPYEETLRTQFRRYEF